MTPEEKAKELYSKFEDSITGVEGYEWWDSAKQCAITATNELISSFSAYKGMYDQEFFDSELNYWKEVKQEIEKI